MTIKRAILFLALASAISTTAAYAAADPTPSDGQWFVTISGSIGDVSMEKISTGGTIGTGVIINGERDGQLEEDEINDYSAGIGMSFGRRIGYWQIAAEYVYRYRTDWDVVVATPAIQSITNVFSNVETHTLLLNAARRGVLTRNWSWELGAGIGLVHHALDSQYIEREVPGVRGELIFEDTSRNSDFSYNVFAGITRDLGRSWTLNMRTRYIDMGDLEAGPFPQRPARLSARQNAVELQFSIERDF